MEEWKEYKLGDCCSKIGSGATPTGGKSVYIEEGINFIRSQNVYNLSFTSNCLAHITEEAAKKLNGVTLCENDILLNITGDSVARCCLLPKEYLPARVNQHVSIIRCKKNLSPQFLTYYLVSAPMQAYLLNIAGKGASRNAITKEMIEKLTIFVPPLPTQQKIASILSAYDNLIQNYKKQIEALQTAASELYKEWFVRFRFPGYQTTNFENGIPEGWKVVLACEIGEFIRGKNITAEEMQEGMIPVISAGIDPSGFHNKSNVKGVSLTISNSGANAGYLQINYSDIWAADCSYCNSSKYIYFYYELLNNMRVVLFNLQKGAAQPHVYAKDINKMKILLPPSELIETADKKIKLMHEKIYSLQQQITNLTQQRDLLLPRLMSGKLEVE